jgi:rhamnogalacturonyl hydrolase YesR
MKPIHTLVTLLLSTLSATVACAQHDDSPFVLDMVYNNLGEPPRASSFNDPTKLAAWGYTGQVPHLYVQCAVTFDSLSRGVMPEDSEARHWIVRQAERIDQRLVEAEAAGIKLYPFTDFLIVPSLVRDRHKSELGDLSIRRPFVQQIIRVQVNEIFKRFPRLGGLTLRFGETYVHDTPHHVGRSPVRSPADHTILINLLREEICAKRNKMLFYRTWDFGNNFHVNPKFYLSATDPVEPHPKLVFAVKHTRGDFFRTLPFNPTLGIGRHQQIVEVQCQREYEGKGAHPNYIARGVIEGFEELVPHKKPKCLRDLVERRTFAGVWTWTRGGGWKGPYLKSEFWCALNAYVISKWAQDPTRSEEAIFRDYAARELDLKDGDVDRFRTLCLLSADGVLRGQYSLLGGVNVGWERDQYLGGLHQLGGAFNGFMKRGLVEKALAEKTEAVAIWREIEALAEEIDMPNTAMKEHCVTSCTYGRIKYDIVAKGWTVMLLGMVGDKAGRYDEPRITRAIESYDRLWEEWKQLEASSPSCATIYRNHYCRYVSQKGMFPASGMNESVDKYRNIVTDVAKSSSTRKAEIQAPSPEAAKQLMRHVNAYQLAHPWKETDRNWIRATYYSGVMAAYRATGDEAYFEQAMRWAKKHEWQVGNERSGANVLTCGQTYLQIHEEKRDAAMIRPLIAWLDSKRPNTPTGGKVWYLEGGRRYADSLYVGPPTLAMLARTTGDAKYLNWMHAFFWDVHRELYDREDDLFYRDKRFIAKKGDQPAPRDDAKGKRKSWVHTLTHNNRKILWSRGNGWVFAGIARILQYLPGDDPQRPRYEALFKEMAASLVKRQGTDGLWRANLADPAEYPLPETSGTGFFCYGLAWGVNAGILDRGRYETAVYRAWRGLAGYVSADGKVQWGQPVAAGPYEVRETDSHEYVTGTFLLAGSEVLKMVSR